MKNFFVSWGDDQIDPSAKGAILAMGNFDGVHLGHQELLKNARLWAGEKNCPAVVLTFEPHPLSILRPPHLRLFDLDDQQAQFKKAQMDGVVYLTFSRDFSELSAEEFLEKIILQKFNPRGIVVGFNFRFGAGRKGTVELLQEWGKKNNCEVHVISSFQIGEGIVSTSEIRKALLAGDVSRARLFLSRPFALQGIVVHGDSRGGRIGFPTANLHLEKVMTPAWGVYATHTLIGGKVFPSVSHLGPLPTFGDNVVRLETHLLGFSGDLYGQTLKVEFIEKIRGVQKFNSVDELREQIQKDIQTAKNFLGVKS